MSKWGRDVKSEGQICFLVETHFIVTNQIVPAPFPASQLALNLRLGILEEILKRVAGGIDLRILE